MYQHTELTETQNMIPQVVDLHNIAAGYDGYTAISGVSLRVYRGEILGVIGTNGSGKTTLLRVIQGIIPLTSGNGQIFGLPLNKAHYRHIQKRSAFVFQTSKIDPLMPVTAKEVVMMGRYGKLGFFKRITETDRLAADQAIKLVDAEHLVNLPYGQLSGGEQQRISLARALAQEPELLLLDEPTTFLDTQSHQRMKDIIRNKCSSKKTTVIIVSHDMTFLKSICHSVLTMNNGEIVTTASEVTYSYA